MNKLSVPTEKIMYRFMYALAAADTDAVNISADRRRVSRHGRERAGDVQAADESATDHSFDKLDCGEIVENCETVIDELEA